MLLENITDGFLGYLVIFFCVYIGYILIINPKTNPVKNQSTKEERTTEENDDDLEPPRNFTQQQLSFFNGKEDPLMQEPKPIYLSLDCTVYDVSEGRDFYGPDGPYACFAGKECGVALAKMSFDDEHVNDFEGIQTKLNVCEKDELYNWQLKFEKYPIKGKVIPNSKLPDSNRLLSKDDLWEHNGKGNIPEGYAAAPIYVGAEDTVFDVSFGGVIFYGPDCSYEVFAGRDATRALALMSLKEEDALNPDVSDLDEKKVKTLRDWKKTFAERKKYPVVGKIATAFTHTT